MRPHGWTVKQMPDDIIKASKNAGTQLIKKGKISKEYLDTIGRDLLSLEEFLQLE